MNRRRNPRYTAKFDVLVSMGGVEGAATLTQLSRSGALLEGASHCPEVGEKVRVYVFIQPVCPFELSGEVTRADESSFAIAYSHLDPEIGRLVDDVAALVG